VPDGAIVDGGTGGKPGGNGKPGNYRKLKKED